MRVCLQMILATVPTIEMRQFFRQGHGLLFSLQNGLKSLLQLCSQVSQVGVTPGNCEPPGRNDVGYPLFYAEWGAYQSRGQTPTRNRRWDAHSSSRRLRILTS